ncbi:hypothetical protein C8R48DRAFT_93728 [Suillus tomentosus]|nr:hypothetical protein C8R48DRAFT_93728 [Suillus tomentosus]
MASVIPAYKIPACYDGLTSFTATNPIMFTSRFAVLALFAFLAGANANGTCAMCQNTVDIEGVAVYTLANSTVETSGYTLCSYTNTKLGIKVTCEYSSDGAFQDGDELCPSKVGTYSC